MKGQQDRCVALAVMASLMALLGEYFFEPTDRGGSFQAQLFTLLALASLYRARLPSLASGRLHTPHDTHASRASVNGSGRHVAKAGVPEPGHGPRGAH